MERQALTCVWQLGVQHFCKTRQGATVCLLQLKHAVLISTALCSYPSKSLLDKDRDATVCLLPAPVRIRLLNGMRTKCPSCLDIFQTPRV